MAKNQAMRISQRMATQEIRAMPFMEHSKPEQQRAWVMQCRNHVAALALPRSMLINADSAARIYYINNPYEHHDHVRDFPNVAPPYPGFAVEMRNPATYINETGEHKLGITDQITFFVCFPVEKIQKMVETGVSVPPVILQTLQYLLDQAKKPLQSMCGPSEMIIQPREDFKPKWMYHMTTYICINSAVYYSGIQQGILVGEDGTIAGGGETWCPFSDDHEAIEQLNILYFEPSLYALNFLHCKGAQLRDAEPGEFDVEFGKKYKGRKPPYYKYKVLEVGGALRRTSKPKNGESQEGIMPLHDCRGHFRRYDPETSTGLFGRGEYGTFWIPDHKRGSMSVGMVDKEYSIKAEAKTPVEEKA